MARMGGIPDGVVSPAWGAYLEWFDGIKDYRLLTREEFRMGQHVWEVVLEEDADALSQKDMAAGLRKAALDGVTNRLCNMGDRFDLDCSNGDRMTGEDMKQETVVIFQNQEAILRALRCLLAREGKEQELDDVLSGRAGVRGAPKRATGESGIPSDATCGTCLSAEGDGGEPVGEDCFAGECKYEGGGHITPYPVCDDTPACGDWEPRKESG